MYDPTNLEKTLRYDDVKAIWDIFTYDMMVGTFISI